MNYLSRKIERNIQQTLARGKSVLLLGPRQTGKTTLIKEYLSVDIAYSFVKATERLRYEKDLALFEKELTQRIKSTQKKPLVYIDEVQKIPRVMDVVQHLIDDKLATFILTGSSARKLKHGHEVNLLPGRVVLLAMHPLLYGEMPDPKPTLETLLLYGSLPDIILEGNDQFREADLSTYVSTYLEEEIRSEALVRNVGGFAQFLEVAAGESGRTVNFTRLSQDVGISDSTIANYYQILDDCMVVHRIEAITQSQTKRRLIKSPRYLFFDLGIRRVSANEGTRLPERSMGHLFEHYVGNELIALAQLSSPQIKIRYWRDSAGPEIDYILEIAKRYIPIEVKWSDKPNESDIKHIKRFMAEYPTAEKAYVVCRTPFRYTISKQIIALPWQQLDTIFEGLVLDFQWQ